MSLLDNPFGTQPRQSPEETSRVIIFGLMMIGLFMAYDMFVQKPQREAMLAQQAVVASQITPAPQPISRDEAIAQETKRVTLENGDLKASINLTGARLDDLVLKKYFETVEKKEQVALLSPSRSINPQLLQFGWLGKDDGTIVPNGNTQWRATQTSAQSVTLQWTSPQNITFTLNFALDDRALFTVKRSVENNSPREITLFPFGRVAREGVPPASQTNGILHEGMIAYVNGELTQDSLKTLDKERTKGLANGEGWIGITDKYWLAAILNPAESGKSDFRFVADEGQFNRPLYQADVRTGAQTIARGDTAHSIQHAFVGPKEVALLDRYSEQLNLPHFDLAVDFGRFYFLTRPFFALLHFLSSTVGSFAIGLLLTSLVIRALTFPLANQTYRSFAKLRKLAPHMQTLKEKYGADRQKMQSELFALYQKEKVNPAAGCFPMLLQIPIFFALYKVLFITIEMRHAPFFGWIQDMSAPDTTTIFNLFGLLPFDPPAFLMIGAWPCIYCITMLLMQRLQPPPAEASQRTIMMLMPFMFTFMLAHFPAGMVIYWSWSNLLSLVQQTIIMKSMGVEIHFFHSSKHKAQDIEIFDTKDDVVLQTVEATEIKEIAQPTTPPKRGRKKG